MQAKAARSLSKERSGSNQTRGAFSVGSYNSGKVGNGVGVILQNYAAIKIDGVKERYLKELYASKCRDLQIRPTRDQERRFFEYCQKTIADRKIVMREQGLGEASAVVLGKIIAGNEKFSHLDLGRNNLGNQGLLQLLQRGLRVNCSIVHLDIGSNDITDEGAIRLFKVLENHPSIMSLVIANHDRLHRNRMGEKSCAALGELLQKNQLLNMLNISDNSITNEGLKSITSGFDLAPSKEIVSLNLSHNDLEGVTAIENLGSLLDNSSSIVSLNLSENKIGDDGVELLSKYFNEGKSRLSKLFISSIGASVNGLKTLFNALRLNQHLTYLCLDGNSLKTPPRITRE
jgi:hypothetical protein